MGRAQSFGKDALEPGIVGLDGDHGVIDDLPDARLLGIGLDSTRTAKFAEKLHQESQSQITTVATKSGRSQSAEKATENSGADSPTTASPPQPRQPIPLINPNMSVNATFTNKDVDAKVQRILDQKAKAGAAEGAKNL